MLHRIFTATAVQAQKKMFNAFSWAKNTARGVHFLLGFNMYLILAQCEQVYLFLAVAQIKKLSKMSTSQTLIKQCNQFNFRENIPRAEGRVGSSYVVLTCVWMG